MAKKRITIVVFLTALLLILSMLPALSLGKGVDRSRVKRPETTVYAATLTIGNMSYNGTLSRMDRVTDEEVEKAIREVLKDMGLNELEVGDMQRFVEKVQSDEQITREDVDEFKERLKTYTGAGVAVDILDVLTGGSGKSVDEMLDDYIEGKVDEALSDIRDKAIDVMIEGGSDALEAADKAKGILDAVIIALDQMEKDKWKHQNRAKAANTWRELEEFYYQVNRKIYNIQTSRNHGWELKIDTDAYKNLTFFTIGNNIETWTTTITMNKLDKRPADPEGPSGTYTGYVDFYVDYNLKEFDKGFAGYITDFWQSNMMMNTKADLTETGDSAKTEIRRRLHHEGKFSLDIMAGKPNGSQIAEYTSYPDFSSFKDDKEIQIKRKLKLTGTQKMAKMNLKVAADVTYSASDVSSISEHIENYTITGKVGGKAVNQKQDFPDSSIGWDEAIWEQWTKEKKLTIKAK